MNSKQDSAPNSVLQFLNQYHCMLKRQSSNAELKIDRQHTDKMDLQEIGKIINTSIIKKVPVKIERNLKDKSGSLAPFIEGVIIGFYQDKLVIGEEFISIDEIYAISLMK